MSYLMCPASSSHVLQLTLNVLGGALCNAAVAAAFQSGIVIYWA